MSKLSPKGKSGPPFTKGRFCNSLKLSWSCQQRLEATKFFCFAFIPITCHSICRRYPHFEIRPYIKGGDHITHVVPNFRNNFKNKKLAQVSSSDTDFTFPDFRDVIHASVLQCKMKMASACLCTLIENEARPITACRGRVL